MDGSFTIKYHHLVAEEDIPKLSSEWKQKIRKGTEERLTTYPEVYGKPLRKSLKGYRKLRVGDWRVIFRLDKNTVKILIIQHQSVVYKNIEKRI
jgi:mRNA interferase RelE/StbE